MRKFIIYIILSLCVNFILTAQEIDPQTQAKITEYEQQIEKYKTEGNTGSVINYQIKLGNLYWQINNADLAIKYYKDAEALLQNSSNTTAKIQIFNSLGYVYMAKAEYQNAEKYFKSAYDLSLDFAETNTLISYLQNIAQCQKNQNKYNEAINSYNEALTLSLEINDLNMVINSASKIALCYQELGDMQNYTYYYNLSSNFEQKLKDEIIQEKEAEANLQSQIAKQNAMRLKAEEYKNKMIADSLVFQQQMNEKNQEQLKQQELIITLQEKELAFEKEMTKAKNKIISILIAGIIIFILAFLMIFRLYILNKKQKEKLKELNKELSQKNEKIESQSVILQNQKNALEIQNQKITDSINYASRIQQAILPVKIAIEDNFKGAFIFYRPRDVVSGDFYWFVKLNNQKIIAAVDCTGHSVPGAFMSMIANTLLNEIIKTKGITKLDEVLYYLNLGVIETLHSTQNVEGVNDGMDISIYKFEEGKRTAKYASANHISVAFIDGVKTLIEGDYFSIGGMEDNIDVKFTEKEINLGNEATLYMFSDGFIDQFNQKGKKYMSTRFFTFLQEMQDKNMHEQEKNIEKEFDSWKQDFRQIDDVLVIGLKI